MYSPAVDNFAISNTLQYYAEFSSLWLVVPAPHPALRATLSP